MARTEETNTLREILRAALASFIAEGGDGGPTPREVNKARKRGELFFYTWWAFKTVEDFDRVNNNSEYPRNIGKMDRVEYEEPGTKDRVVMFNNEKPAGSVTGMFLGMNGMVPLETDFENDTAYDAGKAAEFPIIALGASVARREDWKKDERGFRTLNAEDLRWKWHRWGGKGEDGSKAIKIRGRLIEAPIPPGKPEPANHHDPTALGWAKHVVEGNDGTGIDEDEVELIYTDPSGHEQKKKIETKTVTINGRNVDGIFEFDDVPAGSIIKSIESEARRYNYKKSKIEFMQDLPQMLKADTQEAFMNVVLSKEPSAPRSTEILISPSNDPNTHDKHLEEPYGTKGPTEIKRVGRRIPFPLRITKGPGQKKFYHIFLMAPNGTPAGRHVDLHELHNVLCMEDIIVTFMQGPSSDPSSPKYDHDQTRPYYHRYSTLSNATVTWIPSFRNNAIVGAPRAVLLFVSVQSKEYSADPRFQERLDKLMYYHCSGAGTHASKANLERYGVLDFNFIPILIYPVA